MRLHLVDGTFELFRAHFSRRPARPHKATVGLVASMLALLHDEDEQVTHVAVSYTHLWSAVGGRAPRDPRGPEHPRRNGPPRVAEDERLARDARHRTDRASLDVHGGAARGARSVARSRAARAGHCDVEVVEGRASRGVSRLQPERKGPHDVRGLLSAPGARRARIDATCMGRGRHLRAG